MGILEKVLLGKWEMLPALPGTREDTPGKSSFRQALVGSLVRGEGAEQGGCQGPCRDSGV